MAYLIHPSGKLQEVTPKDGRCFTPVELGQLINPHYNVINLSPKTIVHTRGVKLPTAEHVLIVDCDLATRHKTALLNFTASALFEGGMKNPVSGTALYCRAEEVTR